MVDNTLALQVQPTQFGNNFAAGYNNGMAQQAEKQKQEASALAQMAQIGLGVMDGKLDGPIDPQRLEQAIGLLGNSPIAAKVKENPELLRTITKGSMDVLRYVQDSEKFELAKQQFELDLANAQKGPGLTAVSPGATLYDPVQGKGVFTAPKADGGANGTGETWFGSVVYMRDPATKKVVAGQVSNFGNFKPLEGEPAIPVQQLNTETGFVPVDKFGGTPPDAAVTPINNEQAAYDTGIGKGQAEIDVAKPEKARKAQGALNALERQVGLVSQDIDKAIAAADSNPLFTTGFLGDWTSAVAGTPAYDLKQTLLTIQANIGFDRLQEMRNNSPTGGALGAISDKETALLQAVNGALAQGQSKEQFKANLERVKALQAEVLAERKQAFSTDFGGGGAAPSGTTSPSEAAPGVVDWTDYFD